jgi:quinone-modifying oxidoreductase subunit QmoC
MQVARSLTVETLAAPRFMGKLVGRASVTWPLLFGVPFLFWVGLIYLLNGLTIPEPFVAYKQFVPIPVIDIVFIATAVLVVTAATISGMRFWKLLGESGERSGSFISSLIPALIDIVVHRRFSKCGVGSSRKLGHLTLFFGFVGAFITTSLVVLMIYVLNSEWPLAASDPGALTHPVKILANVSAALLVFGGVALLLNRMQEDGPAGATTAYDGYFLAVVLLVIASGVMTEVGRFVFEPQIACWIYVVHLGSVLTLFATFPYSKFAHMLYRTLAMIHEHMASSARKA